MKNKRNKILRINLGYSAGRKQRRFWKRIADMFETDKRMQFKSRKKTLYSHFINLFFRDAS